jgi:Ca2+-binding EF-hand superfamily protein
MPQHSSPAREFINKTMCRDIKNRLSSSQALKHSWILNNENKVEKDHLIAFEFLDSIKDFMVGNGIKKMVYSYIQTRKLYSDRNFQLIKLFELIDTDHSGAIDEVELFNHYGKFFPGTPEQEMNQIRKIIKNADINGSGKIEYSEFLIIANLLHKESLRLSIKEIFDFFDQDKSNFIEAKDLKLMFNEDKYSVKIYEKMIEVFDRNGDKKISFEEFLEMLTKQL